MIFGYCRISRKTQSIERQVRNILEKYPTAKIYKEAFTGTRLDGRKELNKILKLLRPGDVLIFDSVSRMSRNADEGVKLYFEQYNKGVNLVFLKEPHISTESYTAALKAAGINIPSNGTAEGELVSDIARAITKFMQAKAAADIRTAFEQAQKEVDDLHERTREGIREVKRQNEQHIAEGRPELVKQIGQKKGAKLQIKKKEPAMQIIRKHSRDFEGNLTDTETMKLAGISRNTYYSYKKQLAERLSQEQQEA